METYRERLAARNRTVGSVLCLGVDPSPEALPEGFAPNLSGIGRFCEVLIDAGPGGSPDGFRVDIDGNLWCGWGMGSTELDGVRVFDKGGKPIGHIDLPERCANLCFGGRHRNRRFIASSHSLLALHVHPQG